MAVETGTIDKEAYAQELTLIQRSGQGGEIEERLLTYMAVRKILSKEFSPETPEERRDIHEVSYYLSRLV